MQKVKTELTFPWLSASHGVHAENYCDTFLFCSCAVSCFLFHVHPFLVFLVFHIFQNALEPTWSQHVVQIFRAALRPSQKQTPASFLHGKKNQCGTSKKSQETQGRQAGIQDCKCVAWAFLKQVEPLQQRTRMRKKTTGKALGNASLKSYLHE